MRTRSKLLAMVGAIGAFATWAGCASDRAGMDTTMGNASADFVESTDAWHADRIRKLKAPDGWLSLVALEALSTGVNRVGRGAASEVRYDGFPVDHVGTFEVEGDVVRFAGFAGVGGVGGVGGVQVNGVPSDGIIRTDASGDPTVLSIGDIRFHVIVRGGRLWVRIKDASAPTLVNFTGMDRFPVDEEWRIVATYIPAGPAQFIGMDTVIGLREESKISGRVRFTHHGVDVDAVLLDAGDGGSLLRFGDATNGKETYVVGRYLYVAPSTDGRTVVLDFNRAYNPPCALTAFATCTIPPDSNEFPFGVTAGERWRSGE